MKKKILINVLRFYTIRFYFLLLFMISIRAPVYNKENIYEMIGTIKTKLKSKV